MVKKKEFNPKVQWAKFIGVLVLYLLFLYWVESWWGLLVIPFIFDVYITKKIKWQWWKEAEKPVKFVMSWIDALVFALVAVYFINQFFFQNYVIPSSSLEKSLLTGDYLFVSKVSYGPRIPQTPLTMPLTQHTLPVVECKSYIEWPHWDYRRVKGLGQVQLNDIVVFNYPAGDTICTNLQYQTEYYNLCYGYGIGNYPNMPNPDSLSAEQRLKLYSEVYKTGNRDVDVQGDQAPPVHLHAGGTAAAEKLRGEVVQEGGQPGGLAQLVDPLAEGLLRGEAAADGLHEHRVPGVALQVGVVVLPEGGQADRAGHRRAVGDVPARSLRQAQTVDSGKARAAPEHLPDQGNPGHGAGDFVSTCYI